MRLYLSSYQLGNEPKKLSALVGNNKRVAVICNAIDSLSDAERLERVDRELSAMKNLGFQPEEVDLRNYFGKPELILEELSHFGLLWIRGGNVFILRKAMRLSGFDNAVRQLLDKGIVYAGYSAASCVAGPTLRGIELCDDVNLVPVGYPQETIWEGLGLIEYSVAPHYKSNHPESPMIDKVVNYFVLNNIPYKALHDGEAIVIKKDKEALIS